MVSTSVDIYCSSELAVSTVPFLSFFFCAKHSVRCGEAPCDQCWIPVFSTKKEKMLFWLRRAMCWHLKDEAFIGAPVWCMSWCFAHRRILTQFSDFFSVQLNETL